MLLGFIGIVLAGINPMVLIVGILVLAVVFMSFIPQIKGWMGETAINLAIKLHLDPATYHLIPDIMLPTLDGTTQIDHVIVSKYGIFVVETKNYTGWIFGEEHQPQWTQVLHRTKNRFQNPLRQNYKHTKTLSELSGIPENYFKSVVVFVGDCTFKTEMPTNVVQVENFIAFIRNQQTPIIKDEQVPEIVTTIRAWAGTVTNAQKSRHVENLRQRKEPVPVKAKVQESEPSAPVCPKCGAPMVIRTRKSDGNPFWGCARFPACRGIRQAR